MLDVNCVKAISGAIPAPNPDSLKKKENIGSHMRHTKKISI